MMNLQSLIIMENPPLYVSPEIKLHSFEPEGILCISGEVDDSDDIEFF